jgi:D-alanyl-D-alanine dipeptidase
MKTSFFVFILFLIATVGAQVKTPVEPAVKTPFAESLQAILVTTVDLGSVRGKAQRFERQKADSNWKAVGEEFQVVVGKKGIAWSRDSAPENITVFKKEGDGKAPAGLFPLIAAFGSDAKPDALRLPYTEIQDYTECVDDPNSSHYNTIVDRMRVGNFDWESSEKMIEIGSPYDLGIFVGYNTYPVKAGAGSCIFLHIWSDAATGTAGCTAMARPNLETIFEWIDLAKNPYLVQMTEADHNKYRKAWKLPK